MNEMYEKTDELNNFLNKNKNINGSCMVSFINGSLASIEILPNVLKSYINICEEI